jgi:endonuclease-3
MKKEDKIFQLLQKNYGEVKPFLRFSNPLESLIATILSAQCTDERVNIVTKELFKKYKTPEDYLNVSNEELENDIRSTGFFKNKTKTIKNLCKTLVEKHNGKVPPSMEELTKIPGIGRKTANVVLSQAFGIVEGITVDTHVLRVSQRLGLTDKKDPEKVEIDLMEKFSKDKWYQLSMLLILHGRKICVAKKPKCGECFLNDLCDFVKK